MNHIMRYRMFVFLVLMAAAAVSFAAYDGTKPADNEYVADVPALVRENFRAIKDDAIVNAGAISGYSVGSASGNIPRNDGSLNTNLNSDKLDNKHASDFTASSTYAAHAASTSNPHSVTYTQVGSAASSSTMLTSGANAMLGNILFNGNYGFKRNTSDGSDNGYVYFCGGGETDPNRGAEVQLFGNEVGGGAGGAARYYAGNVSTGDHVFYIGNIIEIFRLKYDGSILASAPIKFSLNNGLCRNTSDGADNGYMYFSGGGSNSNTRGSRVECFGNEHATLPGEIFLIPGNVTGSAIRFYGGSSERMRVTYGGNILIGTTTDDGSNKFQVTGNAKITGNLAVTGVLNIPQSAPSSPANGDIWLQ